MTFLLCGPGGYVHKSDVQNESDDNTHTTHTHVYGAVDIIRKQANIYYQRESVRAIEELLASFRD